jgi:Zn-dependent peptidase ImmA (M78 family)
LALPAGARRQCPTWADALRQMITSAEDAGVLVMVSSIVGNNSDRALGVGEFRGFALADQLAPLIFLNGTDSKVAQMFTLAHELAHLRLDARGVCDMQAGQVSPQKIGRLCNQVAAELLVPLQELVAAYRPGEPVPEVIQRLARQFKVSTLVVLRRLFDAGHLSREALWQHYRTELERLQTLQDRSLTGGAFYRSLGARSGKRLARALVGIALEGLTLLSEAYRLLGVRKTATFRATAQELGVTL